MKENQYEITFTDEQTHQEYQVNLRMNEHGKLVKATAQRNTMWLLGGGVLDNVKVSKLEDRVVKVPVEIKE